MLTYSLKNALLNNVSHFPNPVNNVLLKMNRFPSLIYGSKYMEHLKKLETEHYYEYDNSTDLLNMVNDAIVNVPYYAERHPKKINSIEEFYSSIGFIDKDIIMEDPSKFLSKNIDFSQYDRVTTAGTSGKPLALYVPQNRYIPELSTMHFLWKKAGFDYETRATFRNHKFREHEVYMINPITKEYYFNNYTLTNDYVKQAYTIIKQNKIHILHGYTSGIYQFCLLCKEQGLDLSFIKVVFCASEGVQEFQRKLLVDELGLKLYHWFGHTEKLVIGGYCEHTDNFHMENRYGYFELIDDKGQQVTTAGEVGEIVGTTLMNRGMPFIRYRTGDYAEYVGNYCDQC
jgi:phenylacetate-CoA ligase